MTNHTKEAYAEVYYIICLLEEEFRNKLPNELIKFFEREKSEEIEDIINPNIPLEEQNLLQETINILAMLKLNYWCFDENEKQDLIKLLDENEKKYQEELEKKYNPDNLFKNKNVIKVNEEQTDMIEYKKPNFIIVILNKIRELFKHKS